MHLVFRQSQEEKGMLSKTVHFNLLARVELSEQEKFNINKYKMGREVIFSDERAKLGAAQINSDGNLRAGLWNSMSGLTITVDDMIRGKTIACKEIVEMLDVKATVTSSCAVLKSMLDAAANFEGEEVIEL